MSEETTKFALVGFPLGHSFSKGYFTRKFETQGLEGYTYENFQIEHIEQLRELLTPQIKGLNVTIPHKQSVISLLDELDPMAAQVGAVNCIRITRDGKLVGYNTDTVGFAISLGEMLGRNTPSQALVLGTGGASKAVVYVLESMGISYRMVSRRSGEGVTAYHELTAEQIAQSKLIINTTPLGMYPAIDKAPDLDYGSIGSDHYLYDLVYNPAKTEFLSRGLARGARVKSGLQMLILQAETAWQIWNTPEDQPIAGSQYMQLR